MLAFLSTQAMWGILLLSMAIEVPGLVGVALPMSWIEAFPENASVAVLNVT
jgi:hypothetical protein